MRYDVLIIIVTYNSAHVVEDLLDSLPAALGGLTADVVIVDNGSTDSTVRLLGERSGCRVIESTNGGYAAGVNLGLNKGHAADFVLVLNPDVRLSAGCVAPLIQAVRQPGVGIAAPRVVDDRGHLTFSLRREPTLLRAMGGARTALAALSEYVDGADDYRYRHAVDWALGAALLISRECLQSVGPWDESYFLYSEETDFCLRARDAGFLTVYEPDSTVAHVGAQSGQSDATHAMQILNRVRFYARRHGAVKSWLYFALTVLSEASWVMRGGRRSRFAIRALLRPGLRPAELRLGTTYLPR